MNPAPLSSDGIADAVVAGLIARAAADDLEQAVYGFDALAELGLHPILQQSLRDAGYGVWPEERYPSERGKPARSQGKRCDIVLTPADADGPLREPEIRGTLFDNAPGVDLDDAYWLEVKTVAQFERAGPFQRYGPELTATVTQDVRKLWNDPVIRRAGLLLVLFTADRETAEHDIAAWRTRCLAKGYPVMPPAQRGLRLTDRGGNAWCAVAVFGVK